MADRTRKQSDALTDALTRAKVPHRLSLSDIVWLLLTRQPRELSSVKLSRNAKGETQIEVSVYVGNTDEIATVFDAERVAKDIYDRLRSVYPMADGYTGARAKPGEGAA